MESCDDKYDVIFLLALPMYECYFPLAKKCNVPVIGTFSMRSMSTLDYKIGNPHSPGVVPFFFGSTPMTMTFYERLQNTLNYLCYAIFDKFVVYPKIRNFFGQYSSVSYSRSDSELSLVLGNGHPSIFPRPIVPTYIDIGGIHVENKIMGPLPEVNI